MKYCLSNVMYHKFVSVPETLGHGRNIVPRKFAAVVPRKEMWSEGYTSQADRKAIINSLVSIVNKAYVVGEHSMWNENVRTNSSEIKSKLLNENLILLVFIEEATEKDKNRKEKIVIDPTTIIGQILCDTQFDIEGRRAEFGMFAVQENYHNLGLGTFLISAAEERAKASGCKSLQCEVLSPSKFEHDIKARLSVWYQKLGYKKEIEKDEDGKPVLLENGSEKPKDFFRSFWTTEFDHLASKLSVECKLEVFVKDLS